MRFKSRMLFTLPPTIWLMKSCSSCISSPTLVVLQIIADPFKRDLVFVVKIGDSRFCKGLPLVSRERKHMKLLVE